MKGSTRQEEGGQDENRDLIHVNTEADRNIEHSLQSKLVIYGGLDSAMVPRLPRLRLNTRKELSRR